MLQSLRKKHGYTQEGLAEAMNVDRSYISLVETGRRSPSWRFLAAFANLLHIPVNDLLKAAGLVDIPAVDENEIAALVAANPDLEVIFDLARKRPNELRELVDFAKYLMSKEEPLE